MFFARLFFARQPPGGAGGNAGAVAAGFLFKTEALSWPQALLILGSVVTVSSFLAFAVRFSESEERAVSREMASRQAAADGSPEPAYATEAG